MAAKRLLENLVRNAESHNKTQEEKEMWRLKEKEEKEKEKAKWKTESLRKRYSENSKCGLKRSHSRKESEVSHQRANKYQRELMKMEEADDTRWGHGGFKEHHPEEFAVSTSDSDNLESNKPVPKRKKKLKKSKHKHKKHKKKHK